MLVALWLASIAFSCPARVGVPSHHVPCFLLAVLVDHLVPDAIGLVGLPVYGILAGCSKVQVIGITAL